MVTCEICGRALKNKSGLSGHRRWVHPGEMSGQCPDNVSDNVSMESLGHRAAQRADNVRPSAAVASAETRIDGVSLEDLSDAAIALGLKGLGAKVGHIMIDGVPGGILERRSACHSAEGGHIHPAWAGSRPSPWDGAVVE